MARVNRKLVICLDNNGYEASLECCKIYVALPDSGASRHDCIRVIDESGEGYLYPAKLFVEAELPSTVRRAVLEVADRAP